MVIKACGEPGTQYHVAIFATRPNSFGNEPYVENPLGSLGYHIHFREKKLGWDN